MNKKQSTLLALSLLIAGQAAYLAPSSSAGSIDLSNTVDTKDASKDETPSEGNFSRKKFTLTGDVRFGYDDNTLASPDHVTVLNAAGVPVSRHNDVSDSAFFNADVGLAYTVATRRFTFSLSGDVGVTYYFDRPGRNYDINGGLTLRSTYKLTPRLFLEVSSYNAWVSQGDYGASNLTGFNQVLGAAGRTSADRNGDYFYTTDAIGLTYTLSPRISLVTGGTLNAFAFEDEPYSTDQDRIEFYFSEEFRYLLLPTLTLTADYRYGYVDYFGVNSDSSTHFLLGGLDYAFNTRLRGSVRAGVEFRTYLDSVGDQTSPYAEGTLTYAVARRTNVSLFGRYGIEEGDLSSDVTNSDTVRLGINVDHQITPRISVYGSFYFTHSYYQTPNASSAQLAALGTKNFNEETYDVALGARYAINRNFAVEVGYTHTTVTSEVNLREYDRNRYFGGVRFQF